MLVSPLDKTGTTEGDRHGISETRTSIQRDTLRIMLHIQLGRRI